MVQEWRLNPAANATVVLECLGDRFSVGRSSSSAKQIANRSAALATLDVEGTDCAAGQPASRALLVTSTSGSPHGSMSSKSERSVVMFSAMFAVMQQQPLETDAILLAGIERVQDAFLENGITSVIDQGDVGRQRPGPDARRQLPLVVLEVLGAEGGGQAGLALDLDDQHREPQAGGHAGHGRGDRRLAHPALARHHDHARLAAERAGIHPVEPREVRSGCPSVPAGAAPGRSGWGR